MSLDVLFIMPPYRLVPPFNYQMVDPPRSLALLATILRRDGYSVDVLDTSVTGMSYEEMAEEIGRRQPKTVGICNRSTYSYPMVCKTANIIKERWPEMVVFAGGTYVGHDPEGALRRTRSIDYIAVGEAENNISQMVEMMLRGTDPHKVDGLAFKDKDGNPVRTKTFTPADLSQKILPALDLLPLDLYVQRNERYITELIRGCVHKCPYCTTSLTHGQGIRRRPVEHVIEELKLAKSYGFKYMYFVDDIFTVDRRLVRELCDRMVEEELNLLWPCMTTVGAVDKPTLESMRKAGCDLVAYGVETFSEEALAQVNRLHSLRHMKRAFDWANEVGLRTLAFVIFGMPKSRFRDEMRTIQTLGEIQPDAVRAFSFKPYPGTIYYQQPEKMGLRITNDDYYRFSQLDEPTHETEDLTSDEIIEGLTLCRYLYRSAGTISPGKKLRRRRGVKVWKDAAGGHLYHPVATNGGGGAVVTPGKELRRRPGVQVWKTGEGGLAYNPHNPEERRKTDCYLNSLKLDSPYYEVMTRFDGCHTDQEIAQLLTKLFDMSEEEAAAKVAEVKQKAIDLDLVEVLEDVPALTGEGAIDLDPVEFEVMYRLDGYHNEDDLTNVLCKLFGMDAEAAAAKVAEVEQKALGMDIVEEMPDIMLGRSTFHRGTEEEIYRRSRWGRGESAYRDIPDQVDLDEPRFSASPV